MNLIIRMQASSEEVLPSAVGNSLATPAGSSNILIDFHIIGYPVIFVSILSLNHSYLGPTL